jgi:hypothetical protein
VEAANEVLALDSGVSHQRASVEASTIQHRHLIVVPEYHQINIRNQRVRGISICELTPLGDRNFFLSANLGGGHSFPYVK